MTRQKAEHGGRLNNYPDPLKVTEESLKKGVDIGTIAKLMGHSSPDMIYEHYQFVIDKQKQAEVESLPDIPHVPKKMRPNKKGAAANG